MKLYDFKKLSQKLDFLNFPEVTESRFEIVRKDFSEEEKKGNITFKEDGIYLKINGVEHKGYMYIKVADVEQYDFPKFHISNCQTIIQQQNQNRFHGHYYWSNSNIVDVQQRGTSKIYKDVILSLCNYCRNAARITDYKNTQGFFDLLDIQDDEPINDAELDMFGYVKDWQEISKKFRIENEFTCNNCSIKIENKFDQRFIQVHHRNGNKLINKRENLQCLCTLCHSNIDERHTVNFQKKRSVHEIATFVEKYKDELINIGNPYVTKYLKK
ncbi:HNH endonuclease [Flavobacterium sp. 83]|uniref:HNH endonuclease n=1 Tax=Flavobacterium sp. 83 TaxID=1131812 RepID=UPI00054D999C|nr:HNH endonuclease [Flavobacterium sp. 83]